MDEQGNIITANVDMNKNRIAFIDLAKGLCISIVMLFHIRSITPDSCPLSPVLFTACTLPPFYFLSGYFFREEKTMRQFFLKKANRLLVPFVFFYLTTAVLIPNILHYMFGMSFNTVVGWPSLWAFVWPGQYPNIPLWFLWCLFVMNMLFRSILALSRLLVARNWMGTTAILCVGCTFLGCYAKSTLDTDIANIFEALINLPFFVVGFLLDQKDFIARMDAACPAVKMVLIGIAFGFSLLSCLNVDDNKVWINTLIYYVSGLAGTFLILSISSIIVKLPLISYLGKYSIITVLSHGIMVRMGTQYFLKVSTVINPNIAVVAFWTVMALSYLIIIPFCNHYFPRVTGLFDEKKR